MKKFIAYYRKSTDTEDKQVLSLESQAEVIKDFADRKGIIITPDLEFRESCSAKKAGNRPIFNKIIDLLNSGEAQGLIAYKADRLTRNYGDLDTLIEILRNGVEVWATDFGQYTNDANGHMMLGFNAVIAKRKIDDLSEDTKRGLKTKIANQVWPAWAPLGYLNLDEHGRIAGKQYTPQKQRLLEDLGRPLKRIEIDPVVAPLLKKAFVTYAYQDYSLKKLCELLSEEGLRTRKGQKLKKSALEQNLKNPFYYGVMKWKGEIEQGNHQPLIDKPLFDEVQKRLSGKSPCKSREQKLSFLYRGLLRCGECGCSITAERKHKTQQNGNTHDYIYYRCTKAKGKCSQSYISEPEMEKQLANIFDKFILPKNYADKIQDKLKDLFKEEDSFQERQQTTLKIRLTKLNDEKKRLFRQMTTGEIDDKETYLEVKNDIQNEIFELQNQLSKIGQSTVDWLDQSSNLIYLAQNAGKLFLEGTKEEKQTLVNCVSSDLFLRDKKVEFSLKKPFDILAEGQKSTLVLYCIDNIRTYNMTHYEPLPTFKMAGINC